MNHAFTLNDIRKTTSTYVEPIRAVGILIARPNIDIVKQEILSDINYFYHRSGKYIDFFLPGYGAYWHGHYPDAVDICKVNGVDWSYSDKMFCEFINELESISSWRYSGETELIIINSSNGTLDLTSTMSIWLEAAIKDEAIRSIRNFLETIIRIARNKVDASDFRNSLMKGSARVSIIDILLEQLPLITGKTLKKTKHFVNRNIGKD